MRQNADISKSGDKMIDTLEQAGLTKKEALVYLSLLRQGQVGASKVVRDTGLHGQVVYDSLRTLGDKGLAQYVIVRGRRKYCAKSPRHLSHLIAQRKEKLDSVIENLEAQMIVSPENQFEVYQGRESFIAKEIELLHQMPKGGSVLVIGGDLYAEKVGTTLHQLDHIRMKKNVRVRYIGAESQRARLETEETSHDRLFTYKILPGTFQGTTNYAVFQEVGAYGLYVFSDPVTSFIVQNKKVAADFATFFETLWSMAK